MSSETVTSNNYVQANKEPCFNKRVSFLSGALKVLKHTGKFKTLKPLILIQLFKL